MVRHGWTWTALLAVFAGGAWAADLEVPAGFATIQQAVDASIDGDRILVASGEYTETLSVVGLQLSFEAIGGRARVVGQLDVSMEATAGFTDFDFVNTRVRCLGNSWLGMRNCSLRAWNGTAGTTSGGQGRTALWLSQVASAELTDCEVRGGRGGDGGSPSSTTSTFGGAGGSGIYASGDTGLSLSRCTVIGGDGGDALGRYAYGGGAGGKAVSGYPGALSIADCSMRGGNGGSGGSGFPWEGGEGGDALNLSRCVGRVTRTGLQGGAGGASGYYAGLGGDGASLAEFSAILFTECDLQGGAAGEAPNLRVYSDYPLGGGHALRVVGRSLAGDASSEATGGAGNVARPDTMPPLYVHMNAVFAFDPQLLRDHIAGTRPLSALDILAADPNFDGVLDQADATLMEERWGRVQDALAP